MRDCLRASEQRPALSVLLIAAALGVGASGCPRSKPAGAPDAGRKRATTSHKSPPRAPEAGPLAQKILYEQAKSLLLAGKPQPAVAMFERAAAADGRGALLASCYLGLGSALGELGRHAEALEAYRKVVALRPADPEAHQALAMGLEDAGQSEEARAALERAAALAPDRLSIYQDLASLALGRGDRGAAERAYQRYEARRRVLVARVTDDKRPIGQRLDDLAMLGEARDEQTARALAAELEAPSKRLRLALIAALARQGLPVSEKSLRGRFARATDGDERSAIQAALNAISSAAPAPSPRLVPSVSDGPTADGSMPR